MKKNFLFILLTLLAIQPLLAQVPSYVPTNGLVGSWPFNGNANDQSGNGNNGTVNGATLTADRFGNANSAYNFNGTSNIVLQPGTNIQGNNARTISFWVNITNATQNTNTIYKGGNNGAGNDFSIWYNVNSNNTYQIQVRRFQDDVVTDAIPQILNQWNNISVVYDGTNNSNLKIYINGQIYTGRAFTPAGVTFNTTSTTPQFGDLIDQLGVHHYLKGKIDDVAIWNRALTPQEITNLYNSVNSNECLTMVINSGPLSTNPVTYASTVNIFPNPANDQITIDCGNLANVVGWNIKITNALGQQVFAAPMNTQQYVVPLNSWSGQGMYFVKILNAQNEVVNIKKIILQ